MSAAQLDQAKDYPNFPEFVQYGIDLSLTDYRTIVVLQAIRNAGGFPIYPGPSQNNWGRTYGSKGSEHYAVGRLSTAGDVFPEKGKALRFWILAQGFEEIGGIGLYLDTKGIDGRPWIMAHYDLRVDRQPHRLLWVRDETGNYWYESHNPIQFWKGMQKIIARDVL